MFTILLTTVLNEQRECVIGDPVRDLLTNQRARIASVISYDTLIIMDNDGEKYIGQRDRNDVRAY